MQKIPMTRRFSSSVLAFNRIAMAVAIVGAGVYSGVAQEGSGIERRAAARLEQQAQEAMLMLSQARQYYSEGKYQEALDAYRKSLNLLPKSPNMEQRRQFLELSIADASVAVAQQFIKVGRYDEAKGLLDDALKKVPTHSLAKDTLEKMQDPIRTNPALTPAHVKNVEEVNRLLQLGYGYYELGQFDEADKQFNKVLGIDPYNVAARRGMEHVKKYKATYRDAARDEARAAAIAEVDAAWERAYGPLEAPVEPESFSKPIDDLSLNIKDKLGQIILPKIQLDGVTLEDAVDYLRNQSRVNDSAAATQAERGVNISLQLGSPDSETYKLYSERKISLKLVNVPLREALNYLAKMADLSVRTNTYGVELIAKNADSGVMVSKTLSLPPGFFSELSNGAAESGDVFDAEGGDSGATLKRVDPVKALKGAGLLLPEGSVVRYNKGGASLFFHGTTRDMIILEDLIAAKSAAQPLQVVVSSTFIEVNQDDLEELGFNWLVNLDLDPTRWFMGGGGTDKQGYNQSVVDRAANIVGDVLPANVVGGLRSGNQVFTENGIDAMIERGSSAQNTDGGEYIPGGAPSILTLRGIWSRADVAMIMRGVDQKKGVDLKQHPSVVVRPGETATFFSGRDFIYPTEYEPPELPNNSDVGDSDLPTLAVTPAHPSVFETRQLGTIFNVEVTGVSEDKSIVELNVSPEIVEFDGFINYASPIFMPGIGMGDDNRRNIQMVKVSDNFILQPVFNTRRITAPVRLATGSTMVIGSLKKASTIKYEDKIPVLGDIPWIGRLFRSEGKKQERKVLIIMVKAEIVDPAGKEIYTPPTSSVTAE